jgi:hypothetical protein
VRIRRPRSQQATDGQGPRQTVGSPTALRHGSHGSGAVTLNTRGAFSHLPGFPVLEHLKFSDIARHDDNRLVVVAQGDRRTAIGVWRPATIGYSQFVPHSR